MSSADLRRRHFLLGSGLGLGALLSLRPVPARAQTHKVAIPLAKVTVLRSVGGSVILKVHDRPLLLVRDSPTTVRALDPVCTHRQCVVAYNAAEHQIKCPCHGSIYGVDGHVIQGPAPRPLVTHPAELAGEQVLVTL